MSIFEKVMENDNHAKLNTSEFVKVWQLFGILWLHFYCQTSLNLWFFDFLFCCSKKYLLCFYPMFFDMHIPPIFDPSMNFGLQLSSYKFRTISSKATSIDYNHPSFSSDPTNIHDFGFRFHICKFLIVCGWYAIKLLTQITLK